MNITDKIALVTGGSRGLGRNIALALARNGADVILTYRQRKEEGEAVLGEIEQLGRKAALLQLDVADLGQFAGFFDAIQHALETKWQRKNFDFLINNAGIDSAAPFDKTTEENFDRLFLVHFKGVYFLTQKLLPVIADGGGIVCTSTGLARFAIPGYSAYASMKGAVEVSLAIWRRNLATAASAPTSLLRERLRPISPEAVLSSIPRLEGSSLRRRRSAGSASPMTSVASSPFCARRRDDGSTRNAWRLPAECSCNRALSQTKIRAMKLAQNQVYKQGAEYFRIVQLERGEVRYKAVTNLLTREGVHHRVSKKEFCRLIKGATLLTQSEVREIWLQEGAAKVPQDASAESP